MMQPDRPVTGFIYCLNCFYNLHGLIEHRCPECGRLFDPGVSSTFSGAPDPEHLPKIIQRVALAIQETVGSLTKPDAQAARESALRRRISTLEREHARAIHRMEMLETLLINRGVLTSDDIAAMDAAVPVSEAIALEQIVDDEIVNVVDESGTSLELDALSSAVNSNPNETVDQNARVRAIIRGEGLT